jgi:hypothetical protein
MALLTRCLSVRKAVLGMMAMHRLQDGQQHHSIGGQTPAEKEKLVQEVEQYKKEAERVSGYPRLCASLGAVPIVSVLPRCSADPVAGGCPECLGHSGSDSMSSMIVDRTGQEPGVGTNDDIEKLAPDFVTWTGLLHRILNINIPLARYMYNSTYRRLGRLHDSREDGSELNAAHYLRNAALVRRRSWWRRVCHPSPVARRPAPCTLHPAHDDAPERLTPCGAFTTTGPQMTAA